MAKAATRYAELLGHEHVRPLLAAGVLARMPLGMNSFAALLLVQEESGSFAAAGAVAGASGAAYALVGPMAARVIDRAGQTFPLLLAVVVHTLANAALLAAAVSGSSALGLAALAAVAGATTPPVASSQRALWPTLLRGRPALLDTVRAVDAMSLDLFLILGPLIVAALASLVSPAFALGLGAAMIAIGTLWFVALEPSRSWRGETVRGGRLGSLRSPGVRTLVATIGCTGIALGGLSVAMTGLADDLGSPALAGLLLSMLGVGSLAGGLFYGGRSWTSPVARRYALLLVAFGAGLVPLVLASSLPLAVGLAIVGGLALAPVTACEFVLIKIAAPTGMLTEAYSWAITATFGGSAVGGAFGGELIEGPGWRSAVLACAAVMFAAALLARTATRTLGTPAASP